MILILAGISGFIIGYFLVEIQSDIVDLAVSLRTNDELELGRFMESQKDLFNSIVSLAIVNVVGSYLLLAIHLYGKISPAIYAFFATMRSYMKGNFKARVHLLGHVHIRPYARSFNKFLDHVESQCAIEHNNLK